MSIEETFRNEHLAPYWQTSLYGDARLDLLHPGLRLNLSKTQEGTYTDAQIDDYKKLTRANFPWKPPVRLEVTARFSHDAQQLIGTAGFGFWNHPFSIKGDVLMLPEAVWFFYASSPSNMALVPGIPGWGWKAQIVHSMRPGALVAAVPTALSMLASKIHGKTAGTARWIQRLSGADEALLPDTLTSLHTYRLDWYSTHVDFWIDGKHVHHAHKPPQRPLGFVAWIDNQYAIATPSGAFRFGTLSCGKQWMELQQIRILPLHEGNIVRDSQY